MEIFPPLGKTLVSHSLFMILSMSFLVLSRKCFSISYMIRSSLGAIVSDEASTLNSLGKNLALYLYKSKSKVIWASLDIPRTLGNNYWNKILQRSAFLIF